MDFMLADFKARLQPLLKRKRDFEDDFDYTGLIEDATSDDQTPSGEIKRLCDGDNQAWTANELRALPQDQLVAMFLAKQDAHNLPQWAFSTGSIDELCVSSGGSPHTPLTALRNDYSTPANGSSTEIKTPATADKHKPANNRSDPGNVEAIKSTEEGRRLLCRNLPFDATHEDLIRFFSGYTVTDIMIPPTKRCRHGNAGYAFVDLASSSAAKHAAATFNYGQSIGGREVSVKVASKLPRGLEQSKWSPLLRF